MSRVCEGMPSASRHVQRLVQTCVFKHTSVLITAVPITKLFAWGEGDKGGHVLRETTSQGLCGLVCPSWTSGRGGEGDCVKKGVGGEGERVRGEVCQ